MDGMAEFSNSKVRPHRATLSFYFELSWEPKSSSGSCPAVDRNGSKELPSSSTREVGQVVYIDTGFRASSGSWFFNGV